MSDFQAAPKQDPIETTHAVVGDKKTTVAIQTLQEVFKQITGRNDTLRETFPRNYQVEFGDIEELHEKICQTMQQYNVMASNSQFTTYFINDTKEEVNLFAKLAFQRSASPSQVESISIKYDFMIVLPESKVTQNYTVQISLMSTIAIQRKMEEENFAIIPLYPKIRRYCRQNNGTCEFGLPESNCRRTLRVKSSIDL